MASQWFIYALESPFIDDGQPRFGPQGADRQAGQMQALACSESPILRVCARQRSPAANHSLKEHRQRLAIPLLAGSPSSHPSAGCQAPQDRAQAEEGAHGAVWAAKPPPSSPAAATAAARRTATGHTPAAPADPRAAA